MSYKDTFSITFAERVENHNGMQIIGNDVDVGLEEPEFNNCVSFCQENGIECQIVDLCELLSEEDKQNIVKQEGQLPFARVLIMKNGIDLVLGASKEGSVNKEMYEEQKQAPCDKKAWMRGRVVNKQARWNNCYADIDQEPDYENKKGTIVNFNRMPLLSQLRAKLPLIFGVKADTLYAEMNYYYDLEKTYIGEHGDAERKIVICARLGADFPLYYQWYNRFQPVGQRLKLFLETGDIYAMSTKATGNDWKKSSIYTLRHAAALKESLILKKGKSKSPVYSLDKMDMAKLVYGRSGYS